jgi:glycine cleavage system transcriptional repressor
MSGKTVVLTGVGRDRVGIVAEIAQILYERGCNLLDSSMTLLRGEFAVILMVELREGESVETLSKDFAALQQRLGMVVHVRELSPEEMAEPDVEQNSFIVSVYGADRPGIVAGITRKLADARINITDVQTKSTSTGPDAVFVMILEVSAPQDITGRSVEDSLRQIAAELKVDITVQSLDVVEL